MKAQRLLILVSLVICVGSAAQLATAAPTSAALASAAALQEQPAQPPAQPAAQPAPAQPAPAPNVSVNITRTEDTTMWYMNPFLIGFGVLALILLVVLASRTGESTTTVVR